MKKFNKNKNLRGVAAALLSGFACMILLAGTASASSHREAPLIANDPLADNTDLYVFKSPDDSNSITIIANYIPAELPHGGPNYYTFGENVRYEIHIDNDVSTTGDDITYRATFSKTNEDPTTFFNIRLGKINQKTTYTLERSLDGGASWSTIVTGGKVPPPNIGARSIENSTVGLGTTYNQLMMDAITTASTGETVYCGPADDPFFVDLGGIFDVGDAPRQNGDPRDGLACYNVHSIVIQIPITTLQKDGKTVAQAQNILDADYVIGVWASASRQQIKTLGGDGTESFSGSWVQVSRLGMPLTNEVIIPIGSKNYFNTLTPYTEDPALFNHFYNPELALYMDDRQFGAAVPAFAPLRIQTNSLQQFDFGNGRDGLYPLKGSAALEGTALDDDAFGTLLLPGPGMPRSLDLWPIFNTGVPNMRPYQLATGKGGDPLATGKPFINNFLPSGGDMLRLNMAVPVTPRNSADFNSMGLLHAAVLGLTDPRFADTTLEFIPNMDGFPNGRRLEDDVTRIELQAVSGIVLAVLGLWYDDYIAGAPNPVTQDLLDVLLYTTGVEMNDTTFKSAFPYIQQPWRGTSDCSGPAVAYTNPTVLQPTAFRCDAGRINITGGDTVRTICNGNATDFLQFINTNSTSADFSYIVTDENGVILQVGAGDSLDIAVSGRGIFRVYGVSYNGTLNASPGSNISDLSASGCSDVSGNFIVVTRDNVDASTVSTFEGLTRDTICVDANTDFIRFANAGNSVVANYGYIVTDQNGMILSLTTSDSADLDLGGEGVNRVYGVSYIGAVSVTPGSNISTVSATECFDVSSNFVTIVRDSCSTLGFAEKIHGYSISVFPNPADQALYITTDVQFQQITVLNALGQRVMSLKNVAVGTTMLDISGLDKGVYYITLEGPAGNMRKSFVKQ